jgi:hypothetical protein
MKDDEKSNGSVVPTIVRDDLFTKIDSAIREKSPHGYGLEDVVCSDHFEWYPWTWIARSVSIGTGTKVSATTLRLWAKERGWELNRDER